jgi:uncharacterized protein
VKIDVKITANASHSQIVSWLGERLKIKVKAPAVEGKANAELLRFLAEKLGVRANQLRIVRGETARQKIISIEGVDEEELRQRLEV